jgi:hypothetical protein
MLYPCFIYALFLLYNSIFSDEKKSAFGAFMRCGAISRKNRRLCKPHLTSDFKAFYFLLLLAGSGAAIEAPVKQCGTKLYSVFIGLCADVFVFAACAHAEKVPTASVGKACKK